MDEISMFDVRADVFIDGSANLKQYNDAQTEKSPSITF